MMTSVVPIFLIFARKQRAQFLAHLGLNPPGAAVGHDALGVQRAEIRARRDVARLEFEAEAERLDDPAAHLKFQRIVTEQRRDGRDRCPG